MEPGAVDGQVKQDQDIDARKGSDRVGDQPLAHAFESAGIFLGEDDALGIEAEQAAQMIHHHHRRTILGDQGEQAAQALGHGEVGHVDIAGRQGIDGAGERNEASLGPEGDAVPAIEQVGQQHQQEVGTNEPEQAGEDSREDAAALTQSLMACRRLDPQVGDRPKSQ